jgi:hypothetical protein
LTERGIRFESASLNIDYSLRNGVHKGLGMKAKQTIIFHESLLAVEELKTKFGGQPVWLDTPAWPVSQGLGTAMRFICQIAIDPALFPGSQAQMAYVFMTDDDDHHQGDTWDPESGENAVILQPCEPCVPVIASATGPTLYRMVEVVGQSRLKPQACEFVVTLSTDEDPDFISEDSWLDIEDEEEWQRLHIPYVEALEGNKIGGTPLFLQYDEFPQGESWNLLLQLDSTIVPFDINFGDAGIGYVFLSTDGRIAKMLWQCV